MRGNTVYLEAPDRTQELLNIKWALRSAGYAVGSTWHECTASTSLLMFRDHWNARSVGKLQICDSLVVISGNGDRSIEEVALMAGFAIARGLTVFWVGSPIKGLCDFPAVQQFNTAAEFEKHLSRQRVFPAHWDRRATRRVITIERPTPLRARIRCRETNRKPNGNRTLDRCLINVRPVHLTSIVPWFSEQSLDPAIHFLRG